MSVIVIRMPPFVIHDTRSNVFHRQQRQKTNGRMMAGPQYQPIIYLTTRLPGPQSNLKQLKRPMLTPFTCNIAFHELSGLAPRSHGHVSILEETLLTKGFRQVLDHRCRCIGQEYCMNIPRSLDSHQNVGGYNISPKQYDCVGSRSDRVHRQPIGIVVVGDQISCNVKQ